MREITMGLPQLLEFRRKYALTLFESRLDAVNSLLCLTHGNFILQAEINTGSQDYTDLSTYINAPVYQDDTRIVSHDFSDNTTWTAEDDSSFSIEPGTGKIFAVTDIVVRFDKQANITVSNSAVMKVWQDVSGTLTLVKQLTYPSLYDLVSQSDQRLNRLDNIESVEISESFYRYADTFDFSRGAAVMLRDSLNEKIEVLLSGDAELKDLGDNALLNPCRIVFIGRSMADF